MQSMRFVRWGTQLVLLIAVISGCGRNTTRSKFESVAAELPQVEAEAKRLGVPLSAADIFLKPAPSAADNAVVPLSKALAAFERAVPKGNAWRERLEAAVDSPSASTRERGDEILKALAPALALATEAAAKPAVRFDRDWTDTAPWALEFPELAQVKDLSRAISVRALIRASRGDTAGAVRDFRTGLALGRIIGSDPYFLAVLVQIATEAILTRGMTAALTARPKDTQFHRALLQLAAQASARSPNLYAVSRFEVMYGLAAAKDPDQVISALTESQGEGPISRADLLPSGVPRELVAKAYRARVLQVWNMAYAEESGHKDSLRFLEALRDAITRHSQKNDPTTALNRLAFPEIEDFNNALRQREALAGSFRGLVSALRFRTQKGRPPKTLDEAGFTETDPFDGKPYRLRVDGGTVHVYSVGRNRVDDQGRRREDTVSTFPQQVGAER